jgi:S-methylmethionine-dependent homocysteine/selenocysteine methylase
MPTEVTTPLLSGELHLTDAGLETDLIFNHGIEIREFAAHTLLSDPKGREAMASYFRAFLSLAQEREVGYILDSQTWKAHMHWADVLGATEDELRKVNADSLAFVSSLRDEFTANAKPVLLNGILGPRGDAYAPELSVASEEAEAYHAKQIGWLKDSGVDMLSAFTLTQATEAIGLVRAATAAKLPIVISFTVGTDGKLPSGQPLGEAITAVDDATESGAAYFMVNCAHPDHFSDVLVDSTWARRIHGLRCNASRKSHAELDASPTLDDGNPRELGAQYKSILTTMPWLHVFGGCCGSDLRHVRAIADAVVPKASQ